MMFTVFGCSFRRFIASESRISKFRIALRPPTGEFLQPPRLFRIDEVGNRPTNLIVITHNNFFYCPSIRFSLRTVKDPTEKKKREIKILISLWFVTLKALTNFRA